MMDTLNINNLSECLKILNPFTCLNREGISLIKSPAITFAGHRLADNWLNST